MTDSSNVNSHRERPQMPSPEISIVIPLYDEQDNILQLTEELGVQLGGTGCTYEIILVDDGSSDGTWNTIKQAADDVRIRGMSLCRNFGHQRAMLAGMSQARGQAIITMDGDLQHPPELIPQMIEKWKAGSKIVNTLRQDSADTSFLRRLSSTWFHRVFSVLSGIKMAHGSSDFRLVDRQIRDLVTPMKDTEQFLRGAIHWTGFPSATIAYQAHLRHSGKSKFSLKKLVDLSAGGLISFSSVPLKLGIWLGLLTSVLAFAELVYIIVRYLQGDTIPGWASTLTIISFMFGVLFILLGLIGIYLGRIYDSLKNRPAYIIRETTGPGSEISPENR